MRRELKAARKSIESAYFESLYTKNSDPWQYATSPYETAKYAATIAALPRRRFTSGLDIGCSIGVLTNLLADRCDRLLAIDAASAAIAIARTVCTAHNVEFRQLRVPQQWPDGFFDLIVLSEMLYYLDPSDLGEVASRVKTCLQPGGVILLVHYLGETQSPITGNQATTLFTRDVGLMHLIDLTAASYRIDVFINRWFVKAIDDIE